MPCSSMDGVRLENLLLRDLDLLEEGRDALDGQVPALLALGNQRAKLVHLRDGGFLRQQHFGLGCQPLDP